METKTPDDKPTTRDVWMRGLFMLLFMIGFAIGQSLLNIVAIVQFIWLLFAREPNRSLAHFGNSLAMWIAEIGRFLTCATDDKPFPWAPWPQVHSSAHCRERHSVADPERGGAVDLKRDRRVITRF
jgi:Domain of unknown function (DUF4389)